MRKQGVYQCFYRGEGKGGVGRGTGEMHEKERGRGADREGEGKGEQSSLTEHSMGLMQVLGSLN